MFSKIQFINSNIIQKKHYKIKPYENKNISKCKFVIPANIFQTWHSKFLPPLMLKNIINIKKNNPNFNYFLFDDNDCRKFIQKYFEPNVLNAYDSLIPGAYKADLWRYCILYIYGGIYIDIKYAPSNDFKLYNLLEKEHFVLDINKINIYNAVMVCQKGNEILLKCINQIVENVKNKYYGEGFLHPTGPALLSNFFTDNDKNICDMHHLLYGNEDNDKVIQFNNNDILVCYNGYFKERLRTSKIEHYSILWNKKQIYK